MINNSFNIEYLFVNFHDNDFFMEMCNSAELIIDSFNKELLVPSKHKEVIKMLLPKMMAGFNCLGRWSDCDAQKQINDPPSKDGRFAI